MLANDLSHLRNVHVSAIEEEGKITFLHKVKNGAVDKSYGIHVASLAKLPKELISRADEILDIYEHKNVRKQTFTQTSLFLDIDNEKEEEKDVVLEKLESINPLEMTPMEALNVLYELKNEMKKKN